MAKYELGFIGTGSMGSALATMPCKLFPEKVIVSNRTREKAEKLANHAEGKDDCHDLVEYCRDWAKFEQNHIDALKKYL